MIFYIWLTNTAKETHFKFNSISNKYYNLTTLGIFVILLYIINKGLLRGSVFLSKLSFQENIYLSESRT